MMEMRKVMRPPYLAFLRGQRNRIWVLKSSTWTEVFSQYYPLTTRFRNIYWKCVSFRSNRSPRTQKIGVSADGQKGCITFAFVFAFEEHATQILRDSYMYGF